MVLWIELWLVVVDLLVKLQYFSNLNYRKIIGQIVISQASLETHSLKSLIVQSTNFKTSEVNSGRSK